MLNINALIIHLLTKSKKIAYKSNQNKSHQIISHYAYTTMIRYVCNVLCCIAVMCCVCCCVCSDDAMNNEWRDTATMEQARARCVTEGMSETLEEGALGERVYIYSPSL